METLVAAAVQASAIPGDVGFNVKTAARLRQEAASGGAELAVFPELFLSAYNPPALQADPGCFLDVSEDGTVADPRLDPLRENGIVSIIGAALSYPDGRHTCSSLLIDRDGAIRAVYDKQNLCGDEEKALFVPGDHGATVAIGQWCFGLGICYDGCFPEHARAAAADGDVHGYLIPSGYVSGSEHRRDIYYAARALDNTMYVVFANSVGGEHPWRLNGGSAIYDPEGRCLARADNEAEQIVTAQLKPAQLEFTRAHQTMLLDLPKSQGERRYWLSQ